MSMQSSTTGTDSRMKTRKDPKMKGTKSDEDFGAQESSSNRNKRLIEEDPNESIGPDVKKHRASLPRLPPLLGIQNLQPVLENDFAINSQSRDVCISEIDDQSLNSTIEDVLRDTQEDLTTLPFITSILSSSQESICLQEFEEPVPVVVDPFELEETPIHSSSNFPQPIAPREYDAEQIETMTKIVSAICPANKENLSQIINQPNPISDVSESLNIRNSEKNTEVIEQEISQLSDIEESSADISLTCSELCDSDENLTQNRQELKRKIEQSSSSSDFSSPGSDSILPPRPKRKKAPNLCSCCNEAITKLPQKKKENWDQSNSDLSSPESDSISPTKRKIYTPKHFSCYNIECVPLKRTETRKVAKCSTSQREKPAYVQSKKAEESSDKSKLNGNSCNFKSPKLSSKNKFQLDSKNISDIGKIKNELPGVSACDRITAQSRIMKNSMLEEIRNLKLQNQKYEENISELKNQVHFYQVNETKSKERENQNNNDISDLQIKILLLQTENNIINDAQKNEIKSISEKLIQTESERKTLEQNYNELEKNKNNQINKLEYKYNILLTNNFDLAGKNKKLISNLEPYEKKIKSIIEEHKKIDSHIMEKNLQIINLEKQIEQKNNEIETLRLLNKRSAQKNAVLKINIKELEDLFERRFCNDKPFHEIYCKSGSCKKFAENKMNEDVQHCIEHNMTINEMMRFVAELKMKLKIIMNEYENLKNNNNKLKNYITNSQILFKRRMPRVLNLLKNLQQKDIKVKGIFEELELQFLRVTKSLQNLPNSAPIEVIDLEDSDTEALDEVSHHEGPSLRASQPLLSSNNHESETVPDMLRPSNCTPEPVPSTSKMSETELNICATTSGVGQNATIRNKNPSLLQKTSSSWTTFKKVQEDLNQILNPTPNVINEDDLILPPDVPEPPKLTGTIVSFPEPKKNVPNNKKIGPKNGTWK